MSRAAPGPITSDHALLSGADPTRRPTRTFTAHERRALDRIAHVLTRENPILAAQLSSATHHRRVTAPAVVGLGLLSVGLGLVVIGALLTVWPALIADILVMMIFPAPMQLMRSRLRMTLGIAA